MIWCKLPVCNFMKKPIDGGVLVWDKRRLFGDNKTWKGFIGMILGGAVLTILWGLICETSTFLTVHNYIYITRENTILYNAVMGVLFGIAYAIFELPNSFIKRRMDIKPGKTTGGFKKVLFIFMDQADSIFGCVLVVCIVYSMSIQFYFAYVLVGALTHIILNMLLYLVKLRKNMF
ncbi:CDP-archaeol synthase [Pseudobacteroides cellulosolvens]|nr:CDP-archaeol synthase [Pseudobacteroides cellulosolvens]